MSCVCARPNNEHKGYDCSLTGDECRFSNPDSKQCAKKYNDGPEANNNQQEDIIEHVSELLAMTPGEVLASYLKAICKKSEVCK